MVLMQFSLLIQLYMPRICANFHMPRRLSLSQSGNLARFGNKAMSETVTMEDLDEERRAPDGIAYTYDDFVMMFHPDDFSAANKQWTTSRSQPKRRLRPLSKFSKSRASN